MTLQTSESHLTGHAVPQPRGSFGAGEASPALGLVPSVTSDTPLPVDPIRARIKRMKQGVMTAARLHTDQATQGGSRYVPVMLTLTYRHECAWHERHIADLMKHVRQWMGRRSAHCRYVWVMELTASGRPHYHCLFWLPKGISLPKPDKRGWWPHGMTRIEKVVHAVGYVSKYASKGTSGRSFPQGARIHACGGLQPSARNERSWWLCPAWVRERWPDPAYRPRVCEGGGWISLETGEWEPSPYRVIFDRGRVYIFKRDACA